MQWKDTRASPDGGLAGDGRHPVPQTGPGGLERILDVNYWPVFSIASELLTWIPERIANPVLAFVNDVASDLVDFGAVTFHDLAGRMFQTLIADRKFLATFYTLRRRPACWRNWRCPDWPWTGRTGMPFWI